MQKLNWTAIIISLVIVVSLISTVVYLFPRESKAIDTTGTAQMTVPPDKAVVSIQIQGKAVSAEAAKNTHSYISEQVMAALSKAGIEKENIETENYNIVPDCKWTQEGEKCEGYISSSYVKVSSNEFKDAGKIVDAAVDAGATINYINFELSLEKQNEYKKTVLANAAKDAKSKAEAIAAGVNKKLGDLISISTSDYGYNPYPIFRAAESGVSAKQAAVDLPAKNLDITATVTAKYELK